MKDHIHIAKSPGPCLFLRPNKKATQQIPQQQSNLNPSSRSENNNGTYLASKPKNRHPISLPPFNMPSSHGNSRSRSSLNGSRYQSSSMYPHPNSLSSLGSWSSGNISRSRTIFGFGSGYGSSRSSGSRPSFGSGYGYGSSGYGSSRSSFGSRYGGGAGPSMATLNRNFSPGLAGLYSSSAMMGNRYNPQRSCPVGGFFGGFGRWGR
jgi:hypothetical protein